MGSLAGGRYRRGPGARAVAGKSKAMSQHPVEPQTPLKKGKNGDIESVPTLGTNLLLCDPQSS